MTFELKTLSPEAVSRAMAKAERYRLLNEPSEAESITITDNAIIPLKERVVDEFYDPLKKLLRVFRRSP